MRIGMLLAALTCFLLGVLPTCGHRLDGHACRRACRRHDLRVRAEASAGCGSRRSRPSGPPTPAPIVFVGICPLWSLPGSCSIPAPAPSTACRSGTAGLKRSPAGCSIRPRPSPCPCAGFSAFSFSIGSRSQVVPPASNHPAIPGAACSTAAGHGTVSGTGLPAAGRTLPLSCAVREGNAAGQDSGLSVSIHL